MCEAGGSCDGGRWTKGVHKWGMGHGSLPCAGSCRVGPTWACCGPCLVCVVGIALPEGMGGCLKFCSERVFRGSGGSVGPWGPARVQTARAMLRGGPRGALSRRDECPDTCGLGALRRELAKGSKTLVPCLWGDFTRRTSLGECEGEGVSRTNTGVPAHFGG